MRYLAALLIACGLTFLLLWAGARIATIVSGPERVANDYTVGQEFDLCGYSVDSRFAMAGYDLADWQDERCKEMSDLDHCVLGCLERAGTVEIAATCYEECVRKR
jgi:hypothetical protein